MNALNQNEERFLADIAQLDAYSQDKQAIGRVSGYLPAVADSDLATEIGSYDRIRLDGTIIGERHVLIDGTGTVAQSLIIVPVTSLEVDLRGRRVTVPLTLAQIEAMPKHDPNRTPSDVLS